MCKRSSPTIVLLFAFGLTLLYGCDEAERHKLLTFFFDGVPPPGGEIEDTMDPNGVGGASADAERTAMYTHEPRRDCELCHGEFGKRKTLFSTEMKLLKPVPTLCFDCHDDPSRADGHVHGPVSVGACIFCHSPHRSRFRHLLKKPVPDLCYMCHDATVVRAVSDHSQESYENCLQCHTGHSSSTRSLLKPESQEAQL